MMIKKDQPTIFSSNVIAAASSINDGNMKFGVDSHSDVAGSRRRFLESVGIDPSDVTLVKVTYETDDFTKYRTVSRHDKNIGMESDDVAEFTDALVVDQPNHALFLPLADCVGAIL